MERMPKELLDQGMRVEMEHTSDPAIAREIAADHLKEDRDYYSKLATLEKSKNVREEKKRIFGTDPNAPRTSERRMKMMQRIKDYTERKYGMPLEIAAGKRDESGELRDEGYQKPYDVFTPEGIEEEKKYTQKLKDQGQKRTDPKPDWRSGRLETQPSPDAAVHELAHLDLAPEGMPAPEFQSEMDRLWGESQTKYGHMQQKRTQGEIQPMSVENPIRREIGLPSNRTTKPVKQQEHALDDPEQPRFVEGKDAKGKKAFYDRQARLQSPATKERVQQVREGSLKFDPEIGWYRSTTPDALINLRARGQGEEAKQRVKQRGIEPSKPKKLAASELKVRVHSHPEVEQDYEADHFGYGTGPFLKKNENDAPKVDNDELLPMFGRNPEPHHVEFSQWASKKLPNKNWQIWAARNYRANPESFTPEVKQKLEHFGGSTHIPTVAKVKMGKEHSLEHGLGMLDDAYKAYEQEISQNKQFIVPSKKTKAIIPGAKASRHWHSLSAGACKNEGSAMGHCGNVPSKVGGDNILSLRTVHKVGDKEYHEPHLTFIVNKGILGEMKGKANQKPSPKYHEDIVNLLSNKKIKMIAGGGYEHQNNFSFDDLNEEQKQRVLKAYPDLISGLNENNIDRVKSVISENDKHSIADLIKHPNTSPETLHKLHQDEDTDVRSAVAEHPNTSPETLHKLHRDKDSDVRQAVALHPNVSPDTLHKLHQDEDSNVRSAVARHPNT